MPGIKVRRVCEKCGTEFMGYKRDIERGWARFCSRSCSGSVSAKKRHERHGCRQENNPNWRGGRSKDKGVMARKSAKWKKENPKKVRVANIVLNAKRTGKLRQQPCEVCGCKEVEAHHPDYNKPLDVMWLCRKHHLEWHKNNKAAQPV